MMFPRYLQGVWSLLCLALLPLAEISAQVEPPSHAGWTQLLSAHVSEDGLVDYKGFLQDREPLVAYLELLASRAPEPEWNRAETMAYYLNLYNAGTIALILEYYPLESIRDIPNPWGKNRIALGNRTVSLNDIEHKILRKMGDPRVHFALNCASFSCPKLPREAFEAPRLEAQLEAATRAFINDPLRNRIGDGTPRLSRIFKWYQADFTKGASLESFLNRYLEVPIPAGTRMDYLSYDWSLNEVR